MRSPRRETPYSIFGYNYFFYVLLVVLLPVRNPPVRAHIQQQPAHGPSGGPRNVWGLGDNFQQSFGRWAETTARILKGDELVKVGDVGLPGLTEKQQQH